MAAINTATIAELDDVLADLDFSTPVVTPEPVIIPAPAPHSNLALVSAPNVTPMTERDSFYAAMSDKEAAELQATATRINNRMRSAILDTGNDLLTIKDKMSGHFDQWLKLEFSMSKSSAWNYINAVRYFGKTPKVIDALPAGTVYKLAAKATPDDVRQAVVERIQNNDAPTSSEVEELIADARYRLADEERARKQAEREKAEAERQREEDEAAWQARAKELADDGKSEAEIQKERGKWDTAKAAKVRAKERAKQKRETEEQKRIAGWKAEKEDELENAKRVANWLLTALGPDKFETLRLEFTKSHAWTAIDAVKKMDREAIYAAKLAVAEEKAATEAAVLSAGVPTVDFGAF